MFSGRGGGDGGGGVERVDGRFADEEAEDLAERITGYVDPVPCGFGVAVLLVGECLAAAGFLAASAGEPRRLPPNQFMIVEEFVPEGAVAEHRDDGEIEADVEMVRPTGRRRTWRSSSSSVGMKSSGSSQPAGREGRGAACAVGGGGRGCSGWVSADAAGGSAVRVRRSMKSMSLPAAARASRTRSSAAARRMPRFRWARMVARLAVPKHAAMALKLGAVARWRTVSIRWRP